MKIAVVTTYDRRRKFGQVIDFAFKAVQAAGIEVVPIGPLETRPSLTARVRYWAHECLMSGTFSMERDIGVVRRFSRQIDRLLQHQPVDALLSPMSPASQPTGYLRSDLPVIIWTDTTLAQALPLYPHLRAMCRRSIRDGLENERRALTRACRVVYTSQWAADYAVRRYELDPAKVCVAPFGPAMADLPGQHDIQLMVAARDRHHCRLLSIASAWRRKRIDLAVEVARQLNDRGLETTLTVLGALPPCQGLPEFVRAEGYVNKNTLEGARHMRGLLAGSHFMILPTSADCTPVAFVEAGAFALPVLTTDVGGIASIVQDGVNGWMMPLEAGPEPYVRRIAECFDQFSTYPRLALDSHMHYRRGFTWEVVASQLAEILREAAGHAPHIAPAGSAQAADTASTPVN